MATTFLLRILRRKHRDRSMRMAIHISFSWSWTSYTLSLIPTLVSLINPDHSLRHPTHALNTHAHALDSPRPRVGLDTHVPSTPIRTPLMRMRDPWIRRRMRMPSMRTL